MAGLYLHIPFCKSRCSYCGFYSTTRTALRQRYVDALCRELCLRADYLDEPIHTVYLGGGTPSQLTPGQLRQLFSCIDTSQATEVTMECNPDDVTPSFAGVLAQLPVNRVSMGAQTFSDERLRFLHRRHTATQVTQAVESLRRAGIGNISIDLIYGFPGETLQEWHHDIDAALGLDVEHLSAYALSYEEGTPLYQMLQSGTIAETDEELSLQMYSDLIDRLSQAGYEHYEISNFARRTPIGTPSLRSRHNSSYWNQTPYLGLGAAAHSYDRRSRQWNTADLDQYINGIEAEQPVVEREILDDDARYNDLIMTALRTRDGLNLELLSTGHRDYCLQQAQRFIDSGLLTLHAERLALTRRGLFVSNMVMSEMMKV